MARIVVVTPNPAIDVTYTVALQAIGETHRVTESRRRPGGKGINVALILALLGHDAISVLPLGGDAGRWVRDALGAANAPAAVSPIAGQTRTTVTVIDKLSHPTVFAEKGPHASADEVAHLRELVREQLVRSSFLVISGSLPPGMSPETVGDWIRDAHAMQVRVIVDVSGDALLAASRARADIVKANRSELLDATSAPSLAEGVAALRELGATKVVISRGADGLYGTDGHTSYEVPPIRNIAGNPTGAGDAATAGLVSAIVGGSNFFHSLYHASALGASAVLSPVAGEVDPATYFRFLQSYSRDGALA